MGGNDISESCTKCEVWEHFESERTFMWSGQDWGYYEADCPSTPTERQNIARLAKPCQ